ncbi:MAG: nitroreductase [Bacteroidetes bacterium]|nr:nitroreductase [Bacteroidota bacterium]
MNYDLSVFVAIQKRKSIRTYEKTDIDNNVTADIIKILNTDNTGPFANRARFSIIRTDDYKDQNARLGTYGFIGGASRFIVGAVQKNDPMNLEDYGYILESKILHFTQMGLGTCWIGGSLRRSEFAKTITLKEDEVIPAITPIGYSKDGYDFRDNLIRIVAGSKHRKPWKELFFDEDFSRPFPNDDSQGFSRVLEMVRLAPSASNRQPWRLIRQGTLFHFYLFRRNPDKVSASDVDLQRIDMGIAYCHFELSARELGLRGKWLINKPGIVLDASMEYCASWEWIHFHI